MRSASSGSKCLACIKSILKQQLQLQATEIFSLNSSFQITDSWIKQDFFSNSGLSLAASMITSSVQQLSREQRLSHLNHNISGQHSYHVLGIHSGEQSGNAHGHVSTHHSCSKTVEMKQCCSTQARALNLLI